MTGNNLKVLFYTWFLENRKLSHITSLATFSSCLCGTSFLCILFSSHGAGVNWFCKASVSSVMSSNYFSNAYKQPRSWQGCGGVGSVRVCEERKKERKKQQQYCGGGFIGREWEIKSNKVSKLCFAVLSDWPVDEIRELALLLKWCVPLTTPVVSFHTMTQKTRKYTEYSFMNDCGSVFLQYLHHK